MNTKAVRAVLIEENWLPSIEQYIKPTRQPMYSSTHRGCETQRNVNFIQFFLLQNKILVIKLLAIELQAMRQYNKKEGTNNPLTNKNQLYQKTHGFPI